jgi:CRISPR-associated endoribonuclease Cas6
MRLNLTLSPSTDTIPFNHLHRLTRTLHRWAGPDNALHDGLSLYSFGWLRDAQAQDGALHFPEGSRWRLSFYDPAAAKDVMAGILENPRVVAGMRVTEVQEQAVPAFSDAYRFQTDLAPVVARRTRDDGSREYLTHEDEAADVVLTRVLRRKMKAAGLNADRSDVAVRFDRTYDGADTKLATIKGVDHRGSVCPVIVEGPPAAVRFAWCVGAGELTGSGFGALQ